MRQFIDAMARTVFVATTSALGASLGVQVFFAHTPWLLQTHGGFYLVDAAPYAAIGGGAGAAAGEAVVLGAGAIALERKKAKERRSKLRQLLESESAAQGLSLDQFAVLQNVVEETEKENL